MTEQHWQIAFFSLDLLEATICRDSLEKGFSVFV